MSVFKIYKRHFNGGKVEGLIIEENGLHDWSLWDFWWPGSNNFHESGHDLSIDLIAEKIIFPPPRTEFNGCPITFICEGKSMDEVLDKFLSTHFELFL